MIFDFAFVSSLGIWKENFALECCRSAVSHKVGGSSNTSRTFFKILVTGLLIANLRLTLRKGGFHKLDMNSKKQ